MKNQYLVAVEEFVPKIRDLIHIDTSPESWKENLINCIRIWLSSNGLKWTLNILENVRLDMSTYDASEFIPFDHGDRLQIKQLNEAMKGDIIRLKRMVSERNDLIHS